MKKKLLAVVLSVVMIAALLVPMMAISAADAPTATLSIGTPTKTTRVGNDGVTYDVIAIDVNVSDNTDAQGFFTARYKVISEEGLVCYFSDHEKPAKVDNGFDKGTYTDGDSTFNCTVGRLSEGGKTWFQVVQDSSNSWGIYADAGKLITVYFMAPEAIGTYNFTLEWMDGTDDTPVKYDMTVSPAKATYTVECKSHVEAEPVVTKEATCTEKGEQVVNCDVCGAEISKTEIPALGHDWDNGTVAEDVKCGETADTVFTCKRGCGETKTETGAKVDHDWKLDEAASVAPKCGVAGKKVYVCQRANCPVGTKEEAVAALEHNWELDEDACVDPTCEDAGKDVYVCTQDGCPVGTKEEAVDAIGHDFTGEMVVVTAPTPDATGLYTIACVNGCGEVEEHEAAKLATVVEHKDEDGKVIMGFKAENAILPEDILALPTGEPVEDKETGKISETIAFHSVLTPDLSGEVEFSIDSMGMFTNPVVTNAAGEVEFTFENGVLTFKADRADEYIITYEEVKTSPDTSDAANTVVFAVVALIAVAGLVVVGKKRFAL